VNRNQAGKSNKSTGREQGVELGAICGVGGTAGSLLTNADAPFMLCLKECLSPKNPYKSLPFLADWDTAHGGRCFTRLRPGPTLQMLDCMTKQCENSTEDAIFKLGSLKNRAPRRRASTGLQTAGLVAWVGRAQPAAQPAV
jgi:hypothetical protein